jgi:hypothetical protein
MASRPSAATGRASFMKLFQTPVVEMSRPISGPVKPQDRNMATATPTAMAPPPGRMFATVVEDWLLTAACASVSPGMAATICAQ